MSDPSRTQVKRLTEITIDDYASEIQRGYYPKPGFYGDATLSSISATFTSAVNRAANYAGSVSILINTLVDERDDDSEFHLTKQEYAELEKKARSISGYSNIPFDVIRDFLVILCYIDKIEDMRTIANAIQVPELDDSNILRKPMIILSIPRLEKVSFVASALEALIHMFRKYLQMSQNIANNKKGENIGDILNTLGSLFGGLGGIGGATMRLQNSGAEDALGNFLSELITGKRIPMTVIAKNPMLQAPSYAGKAFFGESPAALSNVDVEQLFAKRIAVFPMPSSGAGTSSFGLQNMGSLSTGISVNQLVSKVLTGSTSYNENSKKARQIEQVVNQINSLTGARGDEVVDLKRADTSLPLMSAISASLSGTDKAIFSSDTFKNGWVLANCISNHIQNTDPGYLEAIKRFL